MNRKGIMICLVVVIAVGFLGAAGCILYFMFKEGGTTAGLISVGMIAIMGYVIYSILIKRYRAYRSAGLDDSDDDDFEDESKGKNT